MYANVNSDNRTIVSIVGPSNSGKSQLAKQAAALLGEQVAGRVPADYFLVPRRAAQSLRAYILEPLQWDWELLNSVLAEPLGTAVSTPDFDFGKFVRTAATGGKPFTIRPVMLIDAMAAFPGADLVVRVDVPETERRIRALARDSRQGSDVVSRWANMEMSWDAARRELPLVDLLLEGTQPLEQNARVLADLIGKRRQA
jgi:uridine kinase